MAQTKESNDNSDYKITEYLGNFIYADGSLSSILTEEGRIVPDGNGGYRYEYNLKDHLGNVRTTFSTTSFGTETSQTTAYYPFGLVMEQKNYSPLISNYEENQYLYNGKELQDEGFDGVCLGWLDYGARMYDPTIGRWNVADKLSEKYSSYSPYVYALNNPIKFIDIDGNEVGIIVTSMANKPGAGKQGHMAIIVGNKNISYWAFSLERENTTYVKNDEVVFSTSVNSIESKIARINSTDFYGHKEDTWDRLMTYISSSAPGVNNSPKNKGYGYDRIALLKNITPEQEAAFLIYLHTQDGADFVYEFMTNNCSSLSIELINSFFGNLIDDKTKVDRPNNEFDKLIKDKKNWEVYKDKNTSSEPESNSNLYRKSSDYMYSPEFLKWWYSDPNDENN